MKRFVVMMSIVLLWGGIVFASGGQNQGTTGSGTTSTGTSSQGSASQDRAGR